MSVRDWRALEMWNPALVMLAVLPPVVATAQARGEADRELAMTLITALEAREASVPPLTMCGVWKGFYTPVYWEIWKDMVSPEELERMVKGDRAAVGLALWQSAQGEEWRREYAGAYRGPNRWVPPKVGLEPGFTADLYHLDLGSRDRVVTLECSSDGLPSVKATTPPTQPPWLAMSLFLSLDPEFGSIRESVGRAPAGMVCRLGPVEHVGDLYTLRVGMRNPEADVVTEMTVDLDSALGLAPTRYRRVQLLPGGGSAFERRWSDFREVGPDGLRLPASAVIWDLDYGYPGVGVLDRTETFVCLELRPTERNTAAPIVPAIAELSEVDCGDVPLDDLRVCRGGAIQRAVGGFAQEEPPDPPADLVHADPAKLRQEIMGRYGFR
jgi:hypothetical protein